MNTERMKEIGCAGLVRPEIDGIDDDTDKLNRLPDSRAASMLDELASVIVDEIVRLRDDEGMNLNEIEARLQMGVGNE